MYFIFAESLPLEAIDSWQRIVPTNFRLFGYSWMGDFFLVSNESPSTGILRTHHAAFDELQAETVEEFCGGFLKDPGVVDSVLRRADVELIETRLGRPDPGEVYIPVPYPWLGGSGDLETYEKGDVWVYASLSGQSWQ